jgi:hypothetical protein
MAEVTSGKNLTAIILDDKEANALGRLLRMNADKPSVKGTLAELHQALA